MQFDIYLSDMDQSYLHHLNLRLLLHTLGLLDVLKVGSILGMFHILRIPQQYHFYFHDIVEIKLGDVVLCNK